MRKGFTLIELMLVIALLATISLLVTPLGINFLQAQKIDEATSEIVSILRRARSQSVLQKNDSAFGVKFLLNSYVLFQGSSYANRIPSNDENFVLPNSVIVGGTDEVVFSESTGHLSSIGTVSVISGNKNKNIIINEIGAVEKQ